MEGKYSGCFRALAIFIASLGLFALAAFTAEQRTKEIGVRKVLGASVTSLSLVLSKRIYCARGDCIYSGRFDCVVGFASMVE